MSNNLNLSQVAAAQNQKEVTINDQAGQLDAALTEVLTVEVDDSNAYVLTDERVPPALLHRGHRGIARAHGSDRGPGAGDPARPVQAAEPDGPDRHDRGAGAVRACAADPCRREPDAVL